MPLDPSIILGIQAPQLQNPMQTLGGLMQLQAQQQQIRSNNMLMQQREQDVRDTTAINGALRKYARPSGVPDYDAAASELDSQGFGAAALKLRTDIFEQRKKAADEGKAQTEFIKTRWALAADSAYTVHDEASFQFWKKSAVGLLAPLLGGEDRVSEQIGDRYDPDRMKQLISYGVSVKDQAAIQHQVAEDQAKAIQLQQEGPKKAAEAFDLWNSSASKAFSIADTKDSWDRARQRLLFGGAPAYIVDGFGEWTADASKRAALAGMTPKERAELEEQAAGRAETARNNRFNNAISSRIQEREDKKFATTYGAGVDEQGKPLPENPTARAIAEYRIPPPSSRSLASGPGMALMDQVMKINPDYRGEEFPTRQKLRSAFTSGQQGQTLNALNTAIVHLDQFADAAKALDNGDFRPGNDAYNWLRTTFGDTAPTNFQGIKTIMAGELASAFKKSGATDAEIASVEKSVNSAASAKQLVEYATKVAMPALSGKAATFDEQYHAVMGDKDPWTPFTKSAAAVMQKHGVSTSHAAGSGGGMVKMQAPDGSVATVPANQVDHYKARGAKVMP